MCDADDGLHDETSAMTHDLEILAGLWALLWPFVLWATIGVLLICGGLALGKWKAAHPWEPWRQRA